MPYRFLRTATIALILGIATASLVRAVNEPAVPPPTGLRAKIDSPNAATLEADILFPAVMLQTDYGQVELNSARLKELSFEQIDADSTVANAELNDGTHFHGTLKSSELNVRIGDESRVLVPVEGMRVRFQRPEDFGIFSAIIGLLTLTLMEIVLGIDNIIFLAILSNKLPAPQQAKARRIGLLGALVTRLLLLFCLTWLLGLTKTVFTLPEMPLFHTPEARGISWRDIILIAGGTFLIGKSTLEIHEKMEKAHGEEKSVGAKVPSFWSIIVQIALMDIIFSLDSVITAVGMVDHLWVMVVAMLIAVGVMLLFAERISRFVDNHPTIKVLALSFLILIGVLLVAESLGQHIDKGYIYFAMAFAIGIEVINMRLIKGAD